MKNRGFVFLAVVLGMSTLYGQELPSGTLGGGRLERREPRIRQLSHGIAATHVPVNWSACGVARIDGVISAGEWSGAASHVITINTSTGTVNGTLYVMNDNLNLYIALKFPESAALYGSLGVEFDNNNNGIPFEQGDDAYVANNQLGFFDDYRTLLPPCTPGDVCGPGDTSDGGTNDGQMAYINDGTYTVYETAHPLNSGDTGHDFALLAGQTVGFFIFHREIDSGGTLYDTYYPDAAVYDQITVSSCAPPVLSGCGTPTLDGIIGAGEWSSAGQFRLSVATPHGGTTPATLYVMNDSFNLYTALAFDQTAILTGGNGMDFTFDKDNNGALSTGDDTILFNAALGFFDEVWVPCGLAICGDFDTNHGGTNDGAAAFANDGSHSGYEFAHPLNSGDSDDVALSYGDSIGYKLSLTMIEPGGVYPGGFGDTNFPNYGQFAKLSICTPAPAQSVADLTKQVNALSGDGSLSSKNADALKSDLSRANGNLRNGKNKQAANDLGNFIMDVQKMIRKGDLSDRKGQPLIKAASTAMSQL